MTLTQRQQQILDFIRDSIKDRGYAPTVRETMDQFKFGSPNTVLGFFRTLEKKGLIVRDTKTARAIRLVEGNGMPGLWAQDAGAFKLVESALVRSRQGWRNVMEVGFLHTSAHAQAKAIIEEITFALGAMGSKETLG